MSWALFIDESGQDGRDSPYEVLAGVAVEDRNIWPLIQRLAKLENDCFGHRLFDVYQAEAKAKKLLNNKVFRLAAQMTCIEPEQRRVLSDEILADGTLASRERLTALAQAKIAFAEGALTLAVSSGAQAFASIVPRSAPRPGAGGLRKDYAYLFERYFHFLNAQPDDPMGLLVFDELDKSASHVLLGQVGAYFLRTAKGKFRSRLIVPEPLFVHSDLTTLIQLADLLAYIISWGVRLKGMQEPARTNLQSLSALALRLRYTHRPRTGDPVFGYKLINDLRPRAVI